MVQMMLRLVGVVGVVLVVGGCSGDPGSATPASTTTAAAVSSSSSSVPSVVSSVVPGAVLSVAEVAEGLGVPLPQTSVLGPVEVLDAVTLRVPVRVPSAPPPGYGVLLAGSGWLVVEVLEGSEVTVAWDAVTGRCLVVYADWDSADAYWMWVWLVDGLDGPDACAEAAVGIVEVSAGLGPPSFGEAAAVVGAPCTLVDLGDGTAVITCPDGTTAVIGGAVGPRGADGADGADGAAGAAGTAGSIGADGVDGRSCAVTDGGATVTVTCSDGTTVVVTKPS